MKHLLLVVVFALPIYGQKESAKPNGQQNHSESANKPSPSPIAQNTPQENHNGASNGPEGYLSRLFSPQNLPNVGLFIAGVVGIYVAIRTLKTIKRQAEWMKRQTIILAEYNKATRDAADATAKSAAATERTVGLLEKQANLMEENIKTIISKEQGRLRLKAINLKMPDESIPWALVEYQVRLYGPTDAIVRTTISDAIISDSGEPPSYTPLSRLSIPAIVSPSDSPFTQYQ
ncbi:MAG: hypothetical protein WCE73_07620, partial [Candidatus Angelobacter sp.]